MRKGVQKIKKELKEMYKEILKINDDDIISAVRYHTTAREGMSLLEKIVYLADFTSEDRDYPGVEDMRKAVEVSIEHAMSEALIFRMFFSCG